MKKLFVFVGLVFVSAAASATTVNINWTVDGDTYAQTSCETGGNFTLPTTPTKYGYHFVGWQQDVLIGAWAQSGTPTPDNPIQPTFKQFGNTVLRAVVSGNNLIADSYDVSTGKITRRIGVRVFDGTEDWSLASSYYQGIARNNFYTGISDAMVDTTIFCSIAASTTSSTTTVPAPVCRLPSSKNLNIVPFQDNTTIPTIEAWKRYLADQYNVGTPVTIYYPLATPVEEDYNAQ